MTAAPGPAPAILPRHGADALRSFNRFEFKYVTRHAIAAALSERISQRLDPDTHGEHGQYQVWSCYYDTPDLRFYWEKIEGLRFRRKLRIRHYGPPEMIDAATPVFVEIKQRVNRVTQKRRVQLPYAAALGLCRGEEPDTLSPRDAALTAEVLRLVSELRLQPCNVVGYVRQAFTGRDEDAGFRITFDARVRGRDRDLDLSSESENRFVLNPALTVVEVKANERVPYWLTDEIARHDLQPVRLSKYCQGIEAFGQAPRSVFHVPEGPDEA